MLESSLTTSNHFHVQLVTTSMYKEQFPLKGLESFTSSKVDRDSANFAKNIDFFFYIYKVKANERHLYHECPFFDTWTGSDHLKPNNTTMFGLFTIYIHR